MSITNCISMDLHDSSESYGAPLFLCKALLEICAGGDALDYVFKYL